MKKKILLLLSILLIFFIVDSNAQFKIGNISLKDSNRVLVINAPASFWATNWIKLADLPNTIAGKGLVWDNSTGLDIVTGTGLKIENDTLKTDLTTILTTNDTTIYINSSGQVSLRVAPNYGLTKDMTGLAIDLSTNSGLTFSGNSLTTSLDSGITVSGNKLKIKTDASVVGFDGSGNLKILPNSITETEVSKDINLDSIKIGGMTMKLDDGKLTIDSTNINGLINFQKRGDGLSFLISETENAYFKSNGLVTGMFLGFAHDEALYIIEGSQDSYGDSSVFIFGRTTTNVSNIDLTINGARLLTAKSDTAFVTTDSVITVSNGNFAVVSDSATIGKLYYMTTTGWTAGSMLTLYFTGTIVVGHAKPDAPANTVPFYLKLTEEFTITDADILTVIYDGTYWREISRIDNTP